MSLQAGAELELKLAQSIFSQPLFFLGGGRGGAPDFATVAAIDSRARTVLDGDRRGRPSNGLYSLHVNRRGVAWMSDGVLLSNGDKAAIAFSFVIGMASK